MGWRGIARDIDNAARREARWNREQAERHYRHVQRMAWKEHEQGYRGEWSAELARLDAMGGPHRAHAAAKTTPAAIVLWAIVGLFALGGMGACALLVLGSGGSSPASSAAPIPFREAGSYEAEGHSFRVLAVAPSTSWADVCKLAHTLHARDAEGHLRIVTSATWSQADGGGALVKPYTYPPGRWRWGVEDVGGTFGGGEVFWLEP